MRSTLVFVYKQQIESFLGTPITNILQNECRKLFGKVGMHSKRIDDKRRGKTSEKNGLSFNATPSKVLSPGRHPYSPFFIYEE